MWLSRADWKPRFAVCRDVTQAGWILLSPQRHKGAEVFCVALCTQDNDA